VARIAAAELERLKREVAIATLAEARGVVLTPHGADLIGRCPFHDDHAPSLVTRRRRICGTAWGPVSGAAR